MKRISRSKLEKFGVKHFVPKKGFAKYAIDTWTDNKSLRIFIGHKFTKIKSYNPKEALLYELSKAIKNGKIKSDKLRLEFTTYELNDYHNVKAIIDKEYKNHDGELYHCGIKYDTIDELIAELSEQKYFEVLTVEEE